MDKPEGFKPIPKPARAQSNAEKLKPATIKIQTVITEHFDYKEDADPLSEYTIGRQVDNLIKYSTSLGAHPNKIVIDLNPPPEPNPAAIDN